MASVTFSEEHAWVASAWVMYYLLERALPRLDKNSSIYQKASQTVTSEIQWLDLVGAPQSEGREFLNAMEVVLEEIRAAGPDSLSTPEAYPGLVARGDELLDILRQYRWKEKGSGYFLVGLVSGSLRGRPLGWMVASRASFLAVFSRQASSPSGGSGTFSACRNCA